MIELDSKFLPSVSAGGLVQEVIKSIEIGVILGLVFVVALEALRLEFLGNDFFQI